MYITHQLKQNQRDQKGLGEDQLPDSRGMGGGTAPAPLDAMRCARRRACAACTAAAPTPSRPRRRRSKRRAHRHPLPFAAPAGSARRTPRAALSPADHASAAEKLAQNGSRSPLAALRSSRGSCSRICFLAWRRGLVTGWLLVVGLLGWGGGGVTVGRLYWLGWV